MALNIETKFPGQSTASDANYPLGSAQDVTSQGAGDGTPWKKVLVDDLFGLQQSILAAGGVTANNSPDSVTNPQYLEALNNIIADRGSQNSISYNYIFDVTTTMLDPGVGNIRLNNSNPSLATSMAISVTDNNGNSTGGALLGLGANDLIYIPQKNDITRFASYLVSSATTNNTTWFEIPIGPRAVGALPAAGAEIGSSFIYCSPGDASETSTGVTILATQAEVNAGVVATKVVTPATLINSTVFENAVKFGCNFSVSGGVPTLIDEINVSSVIRVSLGLFTITFTDPITTRYFEGGLAHEESGAPRSMSVTDGGKLTTSITIQVSGVVVGDNQDPSYVALFAV